jgi:hypothetical protein
MGLAAGATSEQVNSFWLPFAQDAFEERPSRRQVDGVSVAIDGMNHRVSIDLGGNLAGH